MFELTRTQERALEAAREVWNAGGTKKQGVAVGERVILDSTPAGYALQMPGHPYPTFSVKYEPISTPEAAGELADYLAEYGNYPVGMTPCEAAGINGDAGERCPFLGMDFCQCEED